MVRVSNWELDTVEASAAPDHDEAISTSIHTFRTNPTARERITSCPEELLALSSMQTTSCFKCRNHQGRKYRTDRLLQLLHAWYLLNICLDDPQVPEQDRKRKRSRRQHLRTSANVCGGRAGVSEKMVLRLSIPSYARPQLGSIELDPSMRAAPQLFISM